MSGARVEADLEALRATNSHADELCLPSPIAVAGSCVGPTSPPTSRNETEIVAANDAEATVLYFTEILGLEPPVKLGESAVVSVSPDTACATPSSSPR